MTAGYDDVNNTTRLLCTEEPDHFADTVLCQAITTVVWHGFRFDSVIVDLSHWVWDRADHIPMDVVDSYAPQIQSDGGHTTTTRTCISPAVNL
jgi:hypothetical protein